MCEETVWRCNAGAALQSCWLRTCRLMSRSHGLSCCQKGQSDCRFRDSCRRCGPDGRLMDEKVVDANAYSSQPEVESALRSAEDYMLNLLELPVAE